MRSESLALLLLTAAVGCTSTASPPGPSAIPAAAPGERFRVRKGGFVRIAGTPATISFENVVSDNRCPVDVVCIVAGEARAVLRLEEPRKPPIEFVLDTGRTPSATVNGYGVALLTVSPAPHSTVRIEPRDYVVELTVTPP